MENYQTDYFTVHNAEELLGFGNQKVTKLFKKLKTYELIGKKMQGLKLTNLIYIKSIKGGNL